VKKLLIVVGGLMVVLAAAAVLIPTLIDLNDYKAEIAAEIEAATGRKLAIDGTISARLLPSPGASVSGIRLANIPGGTKPDMATLKSIDVDVALAPLLSGQVQITNVTLVEPVVAIETLADGRSNLDFGVPGQPKAARGGAPAASAGGSGLPVRVDRLRLLGGTVTYSDARSGDYFRFDKIDFRVNAESLEGPFAAVGNIEFRGVPIEMSAAVGALDAAPIAVSGDIALAKTAAKLTLRGTLSAPSASGKLSGKVEIAGDDLGRFVGAVAQTAGAEAPALPKLPGTVKVTAALAGSLQEIALNDLSVQLGESKASGAVSVALGPAPKFDVALNVNRLNLDELFKAAAAPASATKPGAGPPAAKPSGLPFEIPVNLNGSVNVEIEALTFRSGIVRQARLDAQLAKGQLKVSRLAAQFPGGSDITLSGAVAPAQGEPQFDGRIEASSDNLRALLQWLAADIADLPADRLRKLSLTGTVRANPQVAQLYGLDLRLDTTRITGGVAYALRTRPSFSADLALDRLNLDSYVPRAKAAPAKEKEQTVKPAAPATAAAAGPLAALDSFDTNIKLRADSLTFREVAIQGAKADLSLVGGQLTVRELSVANLAGNAFALAGTARNFKGLPTFAVNYDVNAGDVTRLLKLADVAAPPQLAKLGIISLKGSAQGSEQDLTIDTALKAAGVDGKLAGRVGGLTAPEKGTVDATLDLRADDIGQIARRLDPATDLKGPARVSGKVAGGLAAAALDLTAQVSGGEVAAKGSVAPLAGPDYKLALSINHPKLTDLLAMAGIAYQPAATDLGGMVLKANLTGAADKVALEALDGTIGPVKVQGAASAVLGGARPAIAADLRTSEILLDLFLPKGAAPTAAARSATPGTRPGAAPAGPRWSNEPLDVAALRDFDADVQLASTAITWGAYKFAEPKVKIALKNGVLDVNPLTGKLFGGEVQLTARLDGSQSPRVALGLAVTRGNLGEAVRQAAGLDSVAGIFDIQAQIAGAGRSQLELVSNLSGQGQLSARQGAIRGFDLKALSERLKRLNEIPDYLALLQTTMGGGTTAFQTIGGTFQMQNGVARTTDIKAVMDAAQGTAEGVIDLPRWTIDLKSRYRLIEHANAPIVGYDLSGSLDNPKGDSKTKELEGFLLQRVGASALRRTLGKDNPLGAILGGPQQPAQQAPATGQTPSSTPPQQQQQQQQQQKPPAQQLLEGLLGTRKKN
jgi:uncharacterized protein involved in outer membrane biogenesis